MNKNEGFTLIELMIIVAIIGVCAALILPAFQEEQAGVAEQLEQSEEPREPVNTTWVRE